MLISLPFYWLYLIVKSKYVQYVLYYTHTHTAVVTTLNDDACQMKMKCVICDLVCTNH